MGCSLCTKPSTWPNTIFLQWRLSAWKVKYVWNDFYLSNHHRYSFSSLSTLFCEKYNYWNWPYSISFHQVSMEHSPSLCFSGLLTSSKISLTLGLVLTRGSRSVKKCNRFSRPSTDLFSMMYSNFVIIENIKTKMQTLNAQTLCSALKICWTAYTRSLLGTTEVKKGRTYLFFMVFLKYHIFSKICLTCIMYPNIWDKGQKLQKR